MLGELLEAERVNSIVGGFFAVYNYFGPGLSESIYSAALELELIARGHQVARELTIPVFYHGRYVGRQRLDMVVDDAVVVENKARDRLERSASAQVISYLKASRFQVGVLLHFGPNPKFYRYIDFPKRRANQIRAHSWHSCPENVMPDSEHGAERADEPVQDNDQTIN